tara:strand:+ start:180 stop:863 length:684 start_codon:yes stop_codon:yes gene_type:complete
MSKIKEKPNYYAVLIAEVRYDNNLSNFSKILYAEISALCNKEGYCWATNSYFAELFDVTSITVTRAITQLVQLGYVIRELENMGDENTARKLRLAITKKIVPHSKNDKRGDSKNDIQNSINKENNKSNNNRTDFVDFWSNLQGRKLNKPDAMRIYSKIKTDLTGLQLAHRFNLMFKTREDKFIPYPAKWLRNEGWEDETAIEKINGDIVYRNKDGYIISEEEYNQAK